MPVSINGTLTTQLSVYDRGLSFGDGVFETCRLQYGQLKLWSFHLERLQQGCQALSIPLDVDFLNQCFKHFLNACSPLELDSGVVKLIVTRGEGGRGYGFAADIKPTIIFTWAELPVFTSQPTELIVCQQRLAVQPLLAGIKHLNRLESVLLKRECQALGAEDGLAVNRDGHIIETTHSNLIFQLDGRLLTPKLNQSGVAGVMRRYLMNVIAPKIGQQINEVDILFNDLASIQGALVCNSIRGVKLVSRIGNHVLQQTDLLTLLQRTWQKGYDNE